jgi:hypothetical protein
VVGQVRAGQARQQGRQVAERARLAGEQQAQRAELTGRQADETAARRRATASQLSRKISTRIHGRGARVRAGVAPGSVRVPPFAPRGR